MLLKKREAGLLPAWKPPKKRSNWYGKLYKEQKQAANFILSRIRDSGGVGLFSEQGTGKTHIACAVIEQLDPQLILIIAPLTSLDITWHPRLLTLPGQLVRQHKQIKGLPGPVTLLIHPEYLVKFSKAIVKIPWDLVIWDESQGIKDRSSARSRAARRLRDHRRRLVLSGTPIDKSQIDVWAQMRFIDHTVFGEKWGDFADEYCRKGGWMNHKWIFRKSRHKQFLKAIEDHIFRLSKKFMELPPLTINPVPVVMFGDQARLYEEMSENSIIEIEGKKIIASMAGVRDVKKSQITGGLVLDDEGKVHRTGFAKIRKFKQLLPKLKKPIVVFCQYLHEIKDIIDNLKRFKTVVLKGSVKGEERSQVLRDFQAGKYDAIVCQLRTGGVSIELSRSCNMVLYSFNYSYIDFEQIFARLHRGGQKNEVTVWVLYCVDTIDEEKIDVIKEKASVAKSVLNHFEERKMAKEVKKVEKKKALGVPELAKLMKLEEQTVRLKLRAAKVKKAGKGYSFTDTEMKSLAKKLVA